jgi:hypothetical protein
MSAVNIKKFSTSDPVFSHILCNLRDSHIEENANARQHGNVHKGQNGFTHYACSFKVGKIGWCEKGSFG